MDHPNLIHAIFTRQGGVSPDPWRSLNVGGTVGDEQARVAENFQRTISAVGRDPGSVYDVWQVHSTRVVVANAPRDGGSLVQADVLVSDNPRVTLFMRFADCVPILLYDAKRGAVGLAHAGWLGTVRDTAAIAVQAMVESFGTCAGDLKVGIGPSIGPDHYCVGPDVVEQVRKTFGHSADRHLQMRNGEVYFNLWTANSEILERQGVSSLEIAEICTACHLEDWYSHRGEMGATGRFGALIALSE